MKVVFKYVIPAGVIATIRMPKGAEILHVAEQHGTPVMWALVNPKAPLFNREFRVAGTGHPIKDEHIGRFIGTILMLEGALVFHVFETLRSLANQESPPCSN